MSLLSIKVPIRKKSGNLFNDPRIVCLFHLSNVKPYKIGHKMYSYNILNFQESTTILNACTK